MNSYREEFNTIIKALVSVTVGSGSKDVTTAGTAEQLAGDTPCKWVELVAKDANTGNIWVGGTNVADGVGRPLLGLQSYMLRIDNLNKVWIDSTVNGEGVTFIYGA